MKKSYCDKCGVETSSSNVFRNAEVDVAGVTFSVTIADAIPYNYDICKYCVLDEIATLDDRDKAVIATPLHNAELRRAADEL
jgi:hypothetical protein